MEQVSTYVKNPAIPTPSQSVSSPKPARKATRSLSKACAACHKRKLRCDAPVVGIPCSRCSAKACGDTCVRVERKYRQRHERPTRTEWLGLNTPTASQQTDNDAAITPTSSGSGFTDIQICREMMTGNRTSRTAAVLQPVAATSRELLQYHHSQHYLSILCEAIGSADRRRRLTRIVLDGMRPRTTTTAASENGPPDPLAGLDEIDREYLMKKRVLELPPRECVESIFKSYFKFVFPYAPVLDKIEFLRDYYSGCYSPFLVQAVLASGSLYAPMAVISACGFGFQSRSEAQVAFCAKAALLYDFECERRQLRMLQGSSILGTTPCIHVTDKEFRFWFHNAVRLAVKMGLNQCDLVNEMDPASYRLCKRIWWFLYSRDVLFSCAGVQNMRLIGEGANSAEPMTIDDCERDPIPPEYAHILSPTLPSQRLCFIEQGMLAILATNCLSTLQDEQVYSRLQDSAYPFSTWRASVIKRLDGDCGLGDHCGNPNVPLMMLIAQSYRLECIIFRLLRMRLQGRHIEGHRLAKQRLRGSMFELDTIIGRVMTKGIMERFPLSFIANIPTLLALHIEVSLDKSEPEVVRALSFTHTRQYMMLLRLMSEFPTIQHTIPVFEWVLKQKGAYNEGLDGGLHGGGLFMTGGDSASTSTTEVADNSIPVANNNATVDDAAKDFGSTTENTDANASELPQDLDNWFEDFDELDYFNNLYLTSFL